MSLKFQASNENSNFHTFGPMGQGSKAQNPGKLVENRAKRGLFSKNVFRSSYYIFLQSFGSLF